MKKVFEFEVPLVPPSVDSIYGISRGKMYKKDIVEQFETTASYYMPRNVEAITVPCFLEVVFYIPKGKKFTTSDTDNFLKVTQDMLQRFGYVKNDCLIYDVYARRRIGEIETMYGVLYTLEPKDMK